MFDILSQPGSGAILLAILIIVAISVSLYKKKNPKEEETLEETKEVNRIASPLDLNDEDATVACLIAAIECRNEYHKNVQVISVKEIN